MKEQILNTTRTIYAKEGDGGLSTRRIAKELGVVQSVLFHHYPSKNELLTATYMATNTTLGIARTKLNASRPFPEQIDQIIRFQFEHAEEIVFVLKYYMHFRNNFEHNQFGFLPEKAHLHIKEIMARALLNGEITVNDLDGDAKVFAHAINGYLLEYFPIAPTKEELDNISDRLTSFICFALNYQSKGGE